MGKKGDYPSSFTIDNFNSTTDLAKSEVIHQTASRETINEKEYNPFEHRETEHPNSDVGSLIHLLKSSLGTGILAMPNAMKNGGLLFGFIGTIITGYICTHCVAILVQASHEICRRTKQPSLGFSETAGEVFKHGPKGLQSWANFAKIFVDIALVVTYYSASCVYIVFISTSIKQLCDYYFPEIENWSVIFYMLIVLLPLIATCQIRELKYLVPFSFLANAFLVVSFSITLYYMFADIKDVSDRDMFSSFPQLPLFFSTVIFAMEGIGVVMPVENSMKKPQHFLGCPGVLYVAMSVVVVLYAVIGFFGYLRYGNDTQGSITFNLPVEEIPAQIVKILIALAVFFTYSLQFYVPFDITWRKLLSGKIPEKYHNLGQILSRSLIIVLCTGVAAAVPDLEPIIGLVGSVCFSILGIFIPAVVDSVIIWEDSNKFMDWRFWKNAVLAIFAIFAMISGSFVSIKSIFEKEE